MAETTTSTTAPMLKQFHCLTSTSRSPRRRWSWLSRAAGLTSSIAFACQPVSNHPPEITYVCGTSSEATFLHEGGTKICGEGDPKLPPEPTLPGVVCQTLVANKAIPDEGDLDSARIKAALDACPPKAETVVDPADPTKTKTVMKPQVVKLQADTANGNGAFVAGHLDLNGRILWIDKGVTLYASRNPELYPRSEKTGLCGSPGVNDASACSDFITVSGNGPQIVGEGAIDGQGGEPLVGRDYSWWQLSQALRETNGSIGNPNLIGLSTGTTGFVAYKISLYNSPKFHLKITSNPPAGETCTTNGKGYIVWGITILTPSKWFNSQGQRMTPHLARNTDGIDPGSTSRATCGVIACSTISTSDDQIAIKGGYLVEDLIIAHNHFGTGHGMSIGSETYGTTNQPAVNRVDVYDLTIDNDSREVGEGSDIYDSNGIRIKSDLSRGGIVTNVSYRDVCMRDIANAVMLLPSYNPLFSGGLKPEFSNITLQNVRHVSCMNPLQPVVTFHGLNAAYPLGPVNLDNVVMDNIGQADGTGVSAQFADFRLGPGNVNFKPEGLGVSVTDEITQQDAPPPCVFPTLPAPKMPAGWLR